MKRLLCAVSMLALVVPGVAMAQNQQNDRHRAQRPERPGNPNGNAQRPNRPGRPDHGSPTIQRVPNAGGHRPGMRPPSNERPTIQPVPSRPDHRHDNANRPGRPTIQPVPGRPNHRPPNAERPGRPSIQPIPNRPGHRPPNFRPIHRPGFHYPRGYHYRRWSIGLILPSIFLSNYYYFNDWGAVGVYPPPPGYIWVRYGPDLLLVNRYTGRIRDVIYGAFY